jgi:hypothetical protein
MAGKPKKRSLSSRLKRPFIPAFALVVLVIIAFGVVTKDVGTVVGGVVGVLGIAVAIYISNSERDDRYRDDCIRLIIGIADFDTLFHVWLHPLSRRISEPGIPITRKMINDEARYVSRLLAGTSIPTDLHDWRTGLIGGLQGIYLYGAADIVYQNEDPGFMQELESFALDLADRFGYDSTVPTWFTPKDQDTICSR